MLEQILKLRVCSHNDGTDTQTEGLFSDGTNTRTEGLFTDGTNTQTEGVFT